MGRVHGLLQQAGVPDSPHPSLQQWSAVDVAAPTQGVMYAVWRAMAQLMKWLWLLVTQPHHRPASQATGPQSTAVQCLP